MMIGSSSRSGAFHKLKAHTPCARYLANQGLPSHERLSDLLLVESDGEWWFNTDSVAKQCKLDGLTEAQINVKLCTGHTHCPGCKVDLSIPNHNGSDPRVGFYDFDVDPVRINRQFACKKCRHQWGPAASGPKDSSLVAVAAPKRDPATVRGPSAPRAGGGTKSIKDALFISVQETHPLSNWEAFRAEYVKQAIAAGIKPSTATAAASKRRRLLGND